METRPTRDAPPEDLAVDDRQPSDPRMTAEEIIEHVAALGPYLRARACKLLRDGPVIDSSASDLVHDTQGAVIQALRNQPLDFAGGNQLKGYCARTLENKYKDKLRRKKLPGAAWCNVDEQPGSVTSASAVAGRNEMAERLRAALAQLGERARALVAWRIQDGMTYDAIGKRLGMTAPGAKQACDKALRQLKRYYDQPGSGGGAGLG